MLDNLLEVVASRPETVGLFVVSETEWEVLVSSPIPGSIRASWWKSQATEFSVAATDKVLLNEGVPLEVTYTLFSDWSKQLTDLCEHQTVNRVGATSLWGRLQSCKVFGDAPQIVALRERYNAPYPEKLTTAILDFHRDFLRGPWQLASLKRAVRYNNEVLVRDLIAKFVPAFLDVLFALNTQCVPDKTNWWTQAKEFKKGPVGWEHSLKNLLTAELPLVPSLWELLAQSLYAPGPLPASSLLVHTDGGCIGNPGPGAWAFLIRWGSEQWDGSGWEELTTNNKMELMAVIQALESVSKLSPRPSQIEIRTDSQYVKNGITTWIRSWMSNGWKTASKEPVKNQDLWERLHRLNQEFQPRWTWVKGHAGTEDNEYCDQLVQKTLRQRSSGTKRP